MLVVQGEEDKAYADMTSEEKKGGGGVKKCWHWLANIYAAYFSCYISFMNFCIFYVCSTSKIFYMYFSEVLFYILGHFTITLILLSTFTHFLLLFLNLWMSIHFCLIVHTWTDWCIFMHIVAFYFVHFHIIASCCVELSNASALTLVDAICIQSLLIYILTIGVVWPQLILLNIALKHQQKIIYESL